MQRSIVPGRVDGLIQDLRRRNEGGEFWDELQLFISKPLTGYLRPSFIVLSPTPDPLARSRDWNKASKNGAARSVLSKAQRLRSNPLHPWGPPRRVFCEQSLHIDAEMTTLSAKLAVEQIVSFTGRTHGQKGSGRKSDAPTRTPSCGPELSCLCDVLRKGRSQSPVFCS